MKKLIEKLWADAKASHVPATVTVTLDGKCVVCGRGLLDHGSLGFGVMLCPQPGINVPPHE